MDMKPTYLVYRPYYLDIVGDWLLPILIVGITLFVSLLLIRKFIGR